MNVDFNLGTKSLDYVKDMINLANSPLASQSKTQEYMREEQKKYFMMLQWTPYLAFAAWIGEMHAIFVGGIFW